MELVSVSSVPVDGVLIALVLAVIKWIEWRGERKREINGSAPLGCTALERAQQLAAVRSGLHEISDNFRRHETAEAEVFASIDKHLAAQTAILKRLLEQQASVSRDVIEIKVRQEIANGKGGAS
jgi:hypothetical protein